MMKALIYLFSLFTIFSVSGNDLLLNVGFEGTLKADKANGSNIPVVKRMKQAEFTKGIMGNAVRMKKNGGIYYETANNINLKQGTIAFWMRPVDWEPSKRTKGYHWIFAANKSGAKVDRLQFFKMPGPLMMLFVGRKGKIKQIPFSIRKWKKNQWHFIAFSWNSDRAKLFIDGRVVGKVKINENGLPVDVGTKICLQAGKETTDYDNLQIYKRALTDSEIENLYIENTPSSAGSKKLDITPATLIAKALKSPVIDGKVELGEWDQASKIDGFLVIPELELSKRKMILKMCYDNEAIYFLVKTEIDKDKSSFSQNDKNVWSAPSAEILFQCGTGEKLPVNHFAFNIFDRHFSQLKGDKAWDPEWESKSVVDNRTWISEIKIPFKSLNKKVPNVDTVWRFNFGRNFIAPRNFANPNVALAYADTKAFWNVKFVESGKNIDIDYDIDTASKTVKIKSSTNSGYTGKELVNLYIKKLPMSLTRIVENLKSISTTRGKVVANANTTGDIFVKKGLSVKFPGAGRYVALVCIKNKKGEVLYRQLQQFIIRDSFSVALKFLSKSQKVFVEWELNSPVKPPFVIKAKLFDDDDKIIASVKQKVIKKTFSGKLKFDMAKLKKLNYFFEVTLNSKKFRQIRKVPFKCYYNAPWIGFEKEIAETHKVPAPWEPLKVKKDTVETLTLKYKFDAQGMPKSILADCKELLVKPIDLKLRVDNSSFKSSKEIQWKSKYSDAATFSVPLVSKNATAQLTAKVEFDGMIRYDLKIKPNKSNAKLTKLVIDISLQNVCAELKYPYCGPYQKWNICDLEGKVNKYYADAFMPHIWVGNTRRGIAWFAESNELYRPFGSRKVVELKKFDDKTVLRINMVTAPMKLTGPVTYTFGIQGTPMKPIASDWTSQILASCVSTKRNNMITMGYTTGREYHIMAGIPYPSKDPERARRWVKGVHRVKGRRAVVYGTSNGIGSKSPQYRFFEQEWKNPLSCDTWSLASRGEYHQGTCPSVESWRDFFLWTVSKALDDYGIDGLYYDFATVSAADNKYADCGFEYKGKTYPTWPIFSDRKMRKRIYQIVMDKRGHADFVFHNYSKSMAPIMSFATMLLDGEVYQQRTGVIGAKITDDYTKLIPLPRLKAMFGAQWGCTPFFLPKLAGNRDDYGTMRLRKATRCMIAMMMPHGIPIWGFYCDIPELNKYTLVQDKFGITNSRFFPCYDLKMDKLLSPAEDKIQVGYWLKKDAALVAIGNLSSKKYSGKLNLNEILPGAIMAKDGCTGKNYPLIGDQKVSIQVPGKDYLLLNIRR